MGAAAQPCHLLGITARVILIVPVDSTSNCHLSFRKDGRMEGVNPCKVLGTEPGGR
jgi:hypothetical protein